MARSYVVPLGLLHLTNDPTGHAAGDTYYNTVSSKIRVYDGTNWNDSEYLYKKFLMLFLVLRLTLPMTFQRAQQINTFIMS